MYTRMALAALLLALFLCPARADEMKKYSIDNVVVDYQDLEEEYVAAYAKAIQIARKSAIEDWGFDMPDTIKMTVRNNTGEVRLKNDGNDGIFFNLTKVSDAHNLPESTHFNMYGMCHEVGHICMYRLIKDLDWFAEDACEAWAHYYGCRTLQKVFDQEGAKLAPGNYDYEREGMPRLEESLNGKKHYDQMVQAWNAMVEAAGEKDVPKIFAEWDKTVPKAEDKSAAAEAALKVCRKAPALAKWWKAQGNGLVANVKSEFKSVPASGLGGKAKELALDDGKPSQKKSIPSGGFVTKFKSPFKKTAITQVKLYGSRYGDQKMDFKICILDEKGMQCVEFSYDYSVFSTDPNWVTLKMKPTTIPETFYVCFLFKADAKDGIYVWYDAGQSGSSFFGVPGSVPTSASDGDWMIRPTVDSCR